jgi:hypothetical protein
VIAYKFLRAGGIGPFSEFRWPPPADGPGRWVDAGGGPRFCERAVHACSLDQLALWLDAELWTVELDGVLSAEHDKLAARRGRLLGRVEAWNADTALEFGAACAQRVAERAAAAGRAGADGDREGWVHRAEALARDAADYAAGRAGDPNRPMALAAAAAFIAAEAAAQDEGAADAAVTERAWQGAWIAARLGLTGT